MFKGILAKITGTSERPTGDGTQANIGTTQTRVNEVQNLLIPSFFAIEDGNIVVKVTEELTKEVFLSGLNRIFDQGYYIQGFHLGNYYNFVFGATPPELFILGRAFAESDSSIGYLAKKIPEDIFGMVNSIQVDKESNTARLVYLPTKGQTIEPPSDLRDIFIARCFSRGIQFGFQECSELQNGLVLARGEPGAKGEDAKLEKTIPDQARKNEKENQKQVLNIGNLQYTEVHTGDILYRFTPPTTGISGRDLYGNEVLGMTGKGYMTPPEIDDNSLSWEQDGESWNMVAKQNGFLYEPNRSNTKYHVESSITLEEISMKATGGVIMTKYDLIVRGTISEDVTCGSLIGKGVLENGATIVASGNVTLGGIPSGSEISVIVNHSDTRRTSKERVHKKGRVFAGGSVTIQRDVVSGNMEGKEGVIINGQTTNSHISGKEITIYKGSNSTLFGPTIDVDYAEHCTIVGYDITIDNVGPGVRLIILHTDIQQDIQDEINDEIQNSGNLTKKIETLFNSIFQNSKIPKNSEEKLMQGYHTIASRLMESLGETDGEDEKITEYITNQLSGLSQEKLPKIYRNIELLTLLIQLQRSKNIILEKQTIAGGLEKIPQEEGQNYSITKGQPEKVIRHRIPLADSNIFELTESEQQTFIRNILNAN